MQVEKILEAMEITSDTTRIRLAAFQLEGKAQVWWNGAKTSKDLEAMTWAEFRALFMSKYFLDIARHTKAQEFIELKQGTGTVIEYVAKFMELARFAEDYVATDLAKVRKFKNELRLSIRGRIVGFHLQDMDSMVETSMIIERGRSRMHGALGMWVLVARGRRVSLLPVQERSRWLLVHVSSKAVAIRAKDRLGLPVRLGKWCATIANNPYIRGGIAPRDRDPRVSGQRSPNQR